MLNTEAEWNMAFDLGADAIMTGIYDDVTRVFLTRAYVPADYPTTFAQYLSKHSFHFVDKTL